MTTKQRRSLTNIGGAIETSGDPELARILADALDVSSEETTHRAHVHGFHTYPARMHPETAARLVEGLTKPGETVLDPFCGSGTVLVEALVHGRGAVGVDLNPLAVELARTKTRAWTDAELEALGVHARKAAEHADARRKARAGATRRYPPSDLGTFDPHVLLELDGILEGLADAPKGTKGTLLLVVSAILVKVSKRRADTTDDQAPKRIAAGYPAKLFVKKTDELVRDLRELAALVPAPRPRVRVERGDALDLRVLEPGAAQALVSSPPYAGTYDYLQHHALRLRWLGLDARPLARAEMGARRAYRALGPDEAVDRWVGELGRFFRAARRALTDDAKVALLVADSAAGGVALRAPDMVARAAKPLGFRPLAHAWQERPHFHAPTARAFARKPRAEHLLLLERAAAAK